MRSVAQLSYLMPPTVVVFHYYDPVMLIASLNYMPALHADKLFTANNLDQCELTLQIALGKIFTKINLYIQNQNSQ